MSLPRISYLAWRRKPDGTTRPRFVPGPRERKLGFAPEDLKYPSGEWMTVGDATRFMCGEDGAGGKLGEIRAARTGSRRKRGGLVEGPKSVKRLLDAFFASDDFLSDDGDDPYSKNTRKDYRRAAKAIFWQKQSREDQKAKKPLERELFSMMPARVVTPANVKSFHVHLKKQRGVSVSRGAIMVLSAAYKWSRTAEGWELPLNPCLQLGLAKPKADNRVYEPFEIVALNRMAEATGHQHIADGCYLALWSSQRPTDVIAYTGGHVASVSEEVEPGKHVRREVIQLKQSKTGKVLELPVIRPLVERLAEIHNRRTERGWRCAELVVNPETGEGFDSIGTFGKQLNRLVTMTAEGRADLGIPPCPSIAGKSLKHFRKTMFTWLHKARNTLPSIAAVTGHEVATVAVMAKHYLAMNYDDAAAAFARLEDWMAREKIAV